MFCDFLLASNQNCFFTRALQTLNTRLKETEEVKTKLEIELRVTRCEPFFRLCRLWLSCRTLIYAPPQV